MRGVVVLLTALTLGPVAHAALQSPGAARGQSTPIETQRETPISPEQLTTAIDRLGTVDYAVRTAAARTIRRAPAGTVVPALLAAVAGHSDGYVRFRSLVLLSGLNDSRTHAVMAQAVQLLYAEPVRIDQQPPHRQLSCFLRSASAL